MTVSGKDKRELVEELRTLRTRLDRLERRNAELVQVEHELRESLEQFKTIFDDSPVGLYRTTPDGRILMANSAVLNMLGYSSFNELARRDLENEGYEPQYPRSQFKERIEREGKVAGLESAWQRSDGTTLYVRESAQAVRDESGKTLYYEGTVEDITEYRQTKDALHESEEMFRALVANLTEGVDIVDENLRCLFANPAGEKIFGVEPGGLVGRTLYEFVSDQSHALVEEQGSKRRKGIAGSYDLEIIRPDGQKRQLIVTGTPRFSEGGKYIGALAIFFDVTEKKRAQEALRKARDELEMRVQERTAELQRANQALQAQIAERINAERQLRERARIIDSTMDAVIKTDPCAVVTMWNRGAERIFGYTSQEMIGQPVHTIYPEQERGRLAEIIESLLRGEEIATTEVTCVHKNGSPVELALSLFPFKDDGGNVTDFVGISKDITSRKRMEEELRIKDNAIASSITAIAIAEFAGNLTYVNNAFLRMWGYEDLNEVLGRPAVEFWDVKEDALRIIEPLRDGRSAVGELVGKRKDGSLFYVELSASAVTDETGAPVYMMGSFTDITERKEAQEALRESENRYRTVIENAGEAIVVVQGDGLAFVNSRATEILPYSEKELTSRPFIEFIHPDDQEKVMEIHTRRLKGQEVPLVYELRVVGKQGNTKWLENNGVLIEWNGRAATLNFLRDITDRKNAEEILREREEMIRALVETSRDWIWSIDLNGVHTYCNPAVERILGYSADELVGRQSLDLIHDDDRRMVEANLPTWVAEKRGWSNLLIRWRHKDGAYRYLESNAVPILSSEQTLVGFRGIDRDITDRKRNEKTLRETTELLETIFAHTHMHVACLDPQFHFVRVNRAYAETDGREPSFFAGRNHFDLYPNAENEAVFRKVVETGVPYFTHAKPFECAEHPERGVTYWDWSLVPIKREDGVVSGLVLTRANVTEQKRVEQALRESEERYHAIFDQAADSIVLIDAETAELVEFNARAHENLGYSREEFAKLKIADLDVVESAEEVLEHAEKVIRQANDSFETKKRSRSGEVRDIQVSARSIALGGKNYIQSIWHDITDRKRAEQALREREATLMSLFRAAPVGIGLERDRVLARVNDTICEMLGYSRDELVEQHAKMFYPSEEDYQRVRGEKRRQIRERGTATVETRWKRKDGRIIDVLLSTVVLDPADFSKGVTFTALDITERKAVEETLRESEEKFRSLADQSPNMIFINKKGRVVYANRKCEEIMGYSREELCSPDFDFRTLVAPESADVIRENFAKHMRGQEVEPYDYCLITKQGERIEAINASKLIQYEGQTAILGVVTDITERKKGEQALRESQERLRILFESAPDAIYVTDLEGRFVDGNRAAEELVGFTKADLVGRSLFESGLLCAEDLSKAAANLRKVAAGQPSGPTEYTVRRKSGSLITVEVRTFPVTIEGRILSLGIARDVTARKHAEEAIKASEKKFRSIFETAANLIASVNEQGIIVDCNNKVREFLGYEKEEILGRSLARIIHADHLDKAQNALKEIIAQGFSYNQEYKMVRKDGSLVDVSINASAVEDEHGKCTRTLCIIDDITDRKRARQRLLDDREQLKSLASQLSLTEERERHRLATVLHDHVGQSLVFSKIKLDQLRKSESAGELSEALKDVSRCLGEVIQHTRTLTFDLSYPVLYELGFEAAVADWLTEEIQEKHGIETEFQDDGQAKPLDDDIRALLFRNVREVLVNIVKHARAKHVKVCVEKADKYICVSVEDDGVGFDAVEVTAMAAKRAKFGLFSVRERLAQLGGHIAIESKPDRGTKITMTAPLKYEQANDGIQR